MNDIENIFDSVDTVVHEHSNLDIYVTAVLLGMNIVNEAKQQLKKPLHRVNLTFNQWLVLKILFLKRADTPTKAANMMNTDPAAITRILDGLELRGLIERMHQTSDRRVIRLNMTSKGIHIAERIYASYAEILKNFENRLMQDEFILWEKLNDVLPYICLKHLNNVR